MTVILSSEATQAAKPWKAPNMFSGKNSDIDISQTTLLSVSPENKTLETQDLTEAGYQAGFSGGYAKGLLQAQEDAMEKAKNESKEKYEALWLEKINRLECMLLLLSNPLEGITTEIETELLELIKHLCEKITRTRLTDNPEKLIEIIRDAKNVLPALSQPYSVKVSSQDMESIKRYSEAISKPELLDCLSVDVALQVGDVFLDTEHSIIDASIRKRLNTLLDEALHVEHTEPSQSVDESPKET